VFARNFLHIFVVSSVMTTKLGRTFLYCCALSGAIACGSSDKDTDKPGESGDSCQPDVAPSECRDGLSCDPLAAGDGHVCGAVLTLVGEVSNALGAAPIAGARLIALNEEGAPVGDVAVSDAQGKYQLLVPAPRNADGTVAATASWTLSAAAQGYQPFPAGPRPAIPISGAQSSGDPARIEAANTQVSLLPLEDVAALDRQIQGKLAGADSGGALVVAEGGPGSAPYGIAARDGSFVLFNVPAGEFEVAGYRRGRQFNRAAADTRSGSLSDLTLSDAAQASGDVSGNVNIVNAPGGSQTSVVLVPQSVFDPTLARGPVPFGLRAPEPPALPSVSSSFHMSGVPDGQYVVLAAFENDELVRDPDSAIAGTDIQRVTVADGAAVTMAESFKITEHLAIVGPGAEEPELVSGTPTFRWADDSSEDRYELELYSALGDLIWSDRSIPSVNGSSTVERAYAGPALTPGMIYQFRVTSFRDRRGTVTAISRSEDLRGVFSYE
jgi:hypothetical protein